MFDTKTGKWGKSDKEQIIKSDSLVIWHYISAFILHLIKIFYSFEPNWGGISDPDPILTPKHHTFLSIFRL